MNTKRILIVLAGLGFLFITPARPSLAAGGGIQGKEKIIAVLGSSVASGWVTSRDAKNDMGNGYAQRLGRRLGPRGFKVVNVSVPGDTTAKVLARMDKDLFPLDPDFVVIGLSPENEGIRGLWGRDSETVYAGFKAGLREIIDRCRRRGIIPILGTCYPNDNFVHPESYSYIKKINLEIAGWDVPSINLLGALDDGSGQFIPGIAFDLDHPADLGHRELFYSIVPSLFEALAAGKPLPAKETDAGFVVIGKGGLAGPLNHVPTDPVHSFTSVIEFRLRSEGTLAAFLGRDGAEARLAVSPEGRLRYRAAGGIEKIFGPVVFDKAWHQAGIVHHGLKNETTLYMDGVFAGSLSETLRPVQLTVGGAEAAEADVRDWMIFRVPLNADEIKTLRSGALLQSSLEVYAPLRRENPRPNREVVNRAQSLAKVILSPADAERDIARLKAAWKTDDEGEKIFADPLEKKAVAVPAEILAACAGTYEGPPGLVLTVEKRGTRLLLHFNGGREGSIELFPLSSERYFAKSIGPEIEVVFGSAANREGRPENLILKVGAQEIPAKRK